MKIQDYGFVIFYNNSSITPSSGFINTGKFDFMRNGFPKFDSEYQQMMCSYNGRPFVNLMENSDNIICSFRGSKPSQAFINKNKTYEKYGRDNIIASHILIHLMKKDFDMALKFEKDVVKGKNVYNNIRKDM